MRFLLPWILSSLLIGYFGRDRRFGFWGFFFFSLILSPLVGALSLLAGAPSRRRMAARAAVSAGRHRALPDVPQLHDRPSVMTSLGIGSLIGLWLGVILIFAAVFFFTVDTALAAAGEATGATALIEAAELSFEVGTLGRAVALPHGLTIVASTERILVLLLLVLMVARLVASRHTTPISEARDAAVRSLRRIDELEETLREHKAAIAALREPVITPIVEPPVPV